MQQINMLPYLIGIARPSGSGKSKFCKLMVSNFTGVSRLKLDDFFKDIEQVGKIGNWMNWDDPSSLKWDELVQAARDLKAGKYAIMPNYDRKVNRAVGEKCVFSSPIILVDGFMTLHDERLRDLLDLKIFFNLSEDSQVKRRRERQPWVEDGYLYNVMLPAARKYIMPSAKYADYVVNAELMPQGVADICLPIIKNALKDRLQKLDRREIFNTVTVTIK